MLYQPGTRRTPGPTLIVTLAAWFVLSSGVVRAHDPGLSALDVRIQKGVVSAQLSLAAADVALIVSDTKSDARLALAGMARNGVRLAVDGAQLPVAVDDVALEQGAARVQMSFAIPGAAGKRLRLHIESDLPTLVARGHRQLVVVTADDRTVAEQLFDAAHPPSP